MVPSPFAEWTLILLSMDQYRIGPKILAKS